MRRPAFSSRASPASRSSFGGDWPAPPSFSHLAIAVSEPWDALIAAPKADIIVTDILLAGSMDGVGLIGRLRRNERAERRPIIVLTACAWDGERERAMRAGCDLFLAKPCVPGELLRHVRSSLADVALQRDAKKTATHTFF